MALSARRLPAALESSRACGAFGRYSILAADPVDFVRIPPTQDGAQSWARRLQARTPIVDETADLPFTGGWIGYVAYESGASAHGIDVCFDEPTSDWGRFALYDTALVHDHEHHQWYAVAVEWPKQRAPVAQRFSELRALLNEGAELDLDEPLAAYTTQPLPNMSRPAYFSKVARAKRYIEAGDIYQVNLTQRFTAHTSATPLELYRALRTASPSWYGAFLQYDGAAILSSSPELFLQLRGGAVLTRPIKGTRPRVGHPQIDAASRRQLQASEKDKAELTMIVDLLRNDLGRVCAYGSVRVTEPATIEQHETVFHQVASIEGKLAPGRAWADLLHAAFPGGSITGAPKIRAMQIIRELEPSPRGVYCGSIGWIGANGDACFNIAIRTLVQREDVVHFHAGGAIVADSEPHEEYDEILAKLAGMLRALQCEAPSTTTRPSTPKVTAA